MSDNATRSDELHAKLLARKKKQKRKAEYAANRRDEMAPISSPKEKFNPGLKHPNFLAHQWKPGQSGNPKGRPKGATLEEVLRKYLAQNVPGTETTRLEAMAKVVFSEGITNRNAKVMKMLFDRLWPQPIKVIGDPANPIVVTSITRKIVDASGD